MCIWDLRVSREWVALQVLVCRLASCGRWEQVTLPIYLGETGALRPKGIAQMPSDDWNLGLSLSREPLMANWKTLI